jgi:ABC-2 type transport system permease protein
MITDISTILWKEFRELFQQRQGMFGRGGWISILITIGLLGVALPAEAGEEWVSNPIYMVWWVWVPFLMVTYIVADTFAGERERHTLETLLASRLSDKAILFGKIAGAVLYGWGAAIAGLIVSLITVNVVAAKGNFLMFSSEGILAMLSLTFLFSLLSSVLGIHISLRSATVRQAQQSLGLIAMIPILPVVFIPMLPEETLADLAAYVSQMEGIVLILISVGAFVLVDILLTALAVKRFQRSKLILD